MMKPICFSIALIFCCSSVYPLQTWLTGDAVDVTASTTQGTVLMGGSSDVGDAFEWMIERSGGGDFVVIRASGSDGYNNWVYNSLGGVNSVATILFESRSESQNQDAVNTIRNAEALFIAGGSQSRYVDYWKDTPVEDAINYLLTTKKVPVGGTSAGCAILTNCYFGAMNGAPSSSEALSNPRRSSVTGSVGINDFLDVPYLDSTISDQHYHQRNREGRHLAFMTHLIEEGFSNVKGIGVDERTAVCVDENGMATVFGSNSAHFIRQYCGEPETLAAGEPLTWRGGVTVYKVAGTPGGSSAFDVADWATGSGGNWEYWWVAAGQLHMADTPVDNCAATPSGRQPAVSGNSAPRTAQGVSGWFFDALGKKIGYSSAAMLLCKDGYHVIELNFISK
ncbi:MAG: cyanophycinase [Chitinivibrionales bacterium]|nr:cyanophycinase [Chitinivibrionales bacterium]